MFQTTNQSFWGPEVSNNRSKHRHAPHYPLSAAEEELPRSKLPVDVLLVKIEGPVYQCIPSIIKFIAVVFGG